MTTHRPADDHDSPAEPRAGAPDTRVETVAAGVARISWSAPSHAEDLWMAVDVVRRAVEAALDRHHRVESHVPAEDHASQRVATWAGLRREGVMRGVAGDRVVYARLATDTPVTEPEGFRALLNSFLPRKRAIAQMLVRDQDERVLMCQLTYKRDWDLPGGVVEVGESPQLAVTREVAEELGLEIKAGGLVLTDWLPAWSGWDDAICLVFDGGTHTEALLDDVVREEREIRHAAFCTLEEVRELAADFTARRVEAAVASLRAGGTAYTESGR